MCTCSALLAVSGGGISTECGDQIRYRHGAARAKGQGGQQRALQGAADRHGGLTWPGEGGSRAEQEDAWGPDHPSIVPRDSFTWERTLQQSLSGVGDHRG